ncbi:hypothetical protein [Aquirufa antheringensis]|jgi:hypothetical protein|uniref:hypothetical protein n=1 Tax=Aquirufa antheringensis TaxID=2516559 RepID=UPI001375AB30|nr:hypothetical protein [Aquirufa antheringensis]MCL9968097.1 hypothetical protein [Aquirufa antheringensis]MCZ2477431.1 hypothetical protein [Aquirufa antheringensis]MCZ2485328.1 hypothetical protein [Aquirufa antheringensis]MCZ2488275.1 hypothetical protein [Aquirufa antheringensis]MCZ2490182.1 hypothetical protein [Aquirufa antheringensis]
MKRPVAIWINVGFRLLVALAYFLVGLYVAFFSEFDLGMNFGIPTIVLFGLLFMAYGLFRIWRAYAYFNSTEENDEEYQEY